MSGVLLIGIGLLSVLAESWRGAPALEAVRQALAGLDGYAWPLPVLAALAVGVLRVVPRAPSLPRLPVAAGVLAALVVHGLLSLARAPWGGLVGIGVARLATLAGPVGGLLVLVVLLAVSAIVAARWSPGETVMRAAGAASSARGRLATLRGLVDAAQRAHASEDAPAAPQTGPGAAEPAQAVVTEDVERDEEQRDDLVELVAGDGEEEADAEPPFWALPTLALLDPVTARQEADQAATGRTAKLIEKTLESFGVQARVIGINAGPGVTQYELQPAAGVLVRRVVALQNDLALALAAAPLRVEAPIPGKSAIGIEVPNKKAALVTIREGLEVASFRSAGHVLGVVVGNDVTGRPVSCDLTRMPHLCIAGATGQGKSVCLNTLLASLLLLHHPRQLLLVLIDPKRVELQGYNGLPHLAAPVIVDPRQAAAALAWAVAEMERRYELLATADVRHIAGYNERQEPGGELPYVVVVIDEFADLMMVAAGDVEESVCRLAQKARAVGIHLVIATQRPSTDVITGLIKANVPSRIAFAVGSQVDSRVILDHAGAEKLLGRGDMLYLPVDAGKPVRLQGAYTSDAELARVVGYWRSQGGPRYLPELLAGGGPETGDDASDRRLDPLFARAARTVAAEGAASVSLVQRKFNVGYSRAGRIVDQLAEHRVIGSYQGSKSREVLMGLPDVDELLEALGLEG